MAKALIPVKHPSVKLAYPVGTILRLKKKGEIAKITRVAFLKDGETFTHYEASIEGRDNTKGAYALYHADIELISLPGEKWLVSAQDAEPLKPGKYNFKATGSYAGELIGRCSCTGNELHYEVMTPKGYVAVVQHNDLVPCEQ